jgi:hypothetical protein
MQTFRQFLQGFKKKYRLAFDLKIPLEDASMLVNGEKLVYVDYMRKMRLTVSPNNKYMREKSKLFSSLTSTFFLSIDIPVYYHSHKQI